MSFQQQDEAHVSFAPTLKREDGHIKFKEEDSVHIMNKARGLYPWPGIFCFFNNKRLKIFSLEESFEKLSPGQVSTKNHQIVIGTKTKSLRLKEIQLEGKKACTDIELLNGLKGQIEIS